MKRGPSEIAKEKAKALKWHRFRAFTKSMWLKKVVLPSNGKEFKEFMGNVIRWKTMARERAQELEEKFGKENRF